jgi:superfamily I DNA and/or RNA helicase
MAFPSKKFYRNRLKIGRSSQCISSKLALWPSGGDKPTMFINTVGDEKMLTVATAEGSEKSKSNNEEIKIVVSVTA